MKSKDYLVSLLNKAGVTINGAKAYDIKIHDDRLFRRLATRGSLAAGEAYVDKWWDCEQLDELFCRICRSNIDASALNNQWVVALKSFYAFMVNLQTRIRSLKVAKEHYDLGNTLYSKMLGPTMAYTCAYWDQAKDLDEAQIHKFDLICRKVDLQKGERVLELGCGWGSLAKYAAENYGVKVIAVNISKEQVAYAKQICQGLPVTVYQCDYRDDHLYNPRNVPFDKILSVGLCEHIGPKNYTKFIQLASCNIKDNGLFLLHTIGRNDTSYYVDPWISTYIFPNSMIPSLKLLSHAFENQFVVEDLQNIGASYDKTLLAWQENFAKNWEALKGKYDEKFYRLWNYYLLSCAGAFRARSLQLWQFVLSPSGVIGGYRRSK